MSRIAFKMKKHKLKLTIGSEKYLVVLFQGTVQVIFYHKNISMVSKTDKIAEKKKVNF